MRKLIVCITFRDMFWRVILAKSADFFYITSGKKRGLLLGNFFAVIIFVTESFREAQEVRSAGNKTTKININS